MRTPPTHTMAFARLLVIHKLGSATQEQMKVGSCRFAVSPSNVRAWIARNLANGLLVQDGEQYSITDEVKAQLDDYLETRKPAADVVPPPRIDRFSKPLTGYAAAMWRGKRQDGLTGEAHFFSGDTAPEPFRGRALP